MCTRFKDLLSNTSALAGSNRPLNGPKKELPTFCVFCKNNGEDAKVYKSHILKTKDGKVLCPVLFNYTCPKCGNSGHNAHTLRYCPYAEKNIATQEKICQDLTPFRTLDSNHQKTEISTHDDSWENEHDTDEEEMMTEEEAYFLTQFRQFPALVQLNIRQLYNVWISSQK